VYDHLREPGHSCIKIQKLLLGGQGQPYSLKTKLFMLAQEPAAIDSRRCWQRLIIFFNINGVIINPVIPAEMAVNTRNLMPGNRSKGVHEVKRSN
jgi:hypothetical protein